MPAPKRHCLEVDLILKGYGRFRCTAQTRNPDVASRRREFVKTLAQRGQFVVVRMLHKGDLSWRDAFYMERGGYLTDAWVSQVIPSGTRAGRKGKNAKQWRGGRETDEGYVRIYAPDHPWPRRWGGYIREHIVVMERHLGRRLADDECVHHKDGNRKNNVLSNLQVMTTVDHIELHRQRGRKRA